MYPGRFDEQPMPLTVMTSQGWRPSSTIACFRAASTPKSPHPGHQSGSALPFRSLTVGFTRSVLTSIVVAIVVSFIDSSDRDFVNGHVLRDLAREDRLHAVDDVVRHERLPVVLADMTVRDDARFR